MRKIKIMEHISLDGVIQHSADDGAFPYSDWTAPYRTPAGREAIIAAHGESFDLLGGSLRCGLTGRQSRDGNRRHRAHSGRAQRAWRCVRRIRPAWTQNCERHRRDRRELSKQGSR